MKSVIAIITISLLVALYLFWHFENKRRRKNADHHKKRHAELESLIKTLKEKNPSEEE